LSSILRALKKLENEPRHLDESRHLDNKFVPLADIGTQRPISSIFIMVVGGGIVCGLVILAGWWFFSGKAQAPISETQKISLPDSKLAEISPAPSMDLNKKRVETVTEEAGKLSLETSETKKKVEYVRATETVGLVESFPHVTDEKDISSAERQTPEEVAPAQVIPNLKENEQRLQISEEPVIISENPPATPEKTAEVEIPKLNDPDMKLQAVTWSRVPQKRIAVINNRILREGDMVSGYLIISINQDDVVISRGGKKWKFFFR
jgi:hypothetical protein